MQYVQRITWLRRIATNPGLGLGMSCTPLVKGVLMGTPGPWILEGVAPGSSCYSADLGRRDSAVLRVFFTLCCVPINFMTVFAACASQVEAATRQLFLHSSYLGCL